MIEKTNCQRCAQPIEFELDDWFDGIELDCPHCQQRTALLLPRVDPNRPKPKPRPLPPPLPDAPDLIEDSLETMGVLYLVGGIIAAVIIGFNAVIHLANSQPDRALVPGLIAAAVLGQAWVVRTLIYGFAEVIRLLRKRKQ